MERKLIPKALRDTASVLRSNSLHSSTIQLVTGHQKNQYYVNKRINAVNSDMIRKAECALGRNVHATTNVTRLNDPIVRVAGAQT
jgi:hypothetical protein